jgi:hypothetical protein
MMKMDFDDKVFSAALGNLAVWILDDAPLVELWIDEHIS